MNYEFKGTPGSWKIHRLFESPNTCVDEGKTWSHLTHWIMQDNTNAIIGDVRYQSEDSGYPSVKHLPEMEANAHLISAAPELLQACIDVENTLRTMTNNPVSDLLMTRLQQAIHKALNLPTT